VFSIKTAQTCILVWTKKTGGFNVFVCFLVLFNIFNLQMVFISCLHFDWVIVQKIYIFNHANNISFFFCLLLIYSLMLCFWRYKVLLYPCTTQFLNYTISLHMKYYFFMIHWNYALILGLHFRVKMFRFMADFIFKKIYLVFFHISHSFQCGVILTPKTRSVKNFFYIPSEQPNQAKFVCV